MFIVRVMELHRFEFLNDSSMNVLVTEEEGKEVESSFHKLNESIYREPQGPKFTQYQSIKRTTYGTSDESKNISSNVDFQFVYKICDENFQNIELLKNHSAKYHIRNESISYIEPKPVEQSKNIEPMSEIISYFQQTIVEVREELEKFLSTSN